MAFCQNCGKELMDGAKFCDSCGTPAGNTGSENQRKQDDMFLIAGRCGTLIRRDKGAGSRLCQNARKS
ncbi:zinc-ribbon domain-containing protein [Treponema sp. OMZ 857]|uniref:zinc-ribbon domain-containing protein n=1 Tax=Treponema sp. OMZ 857 TaxID=1643513 RepID=UPI0021F990FE|nr:zinc-ribbon domain-containing protein [Treponema sp. OMZ 857]